jgi:hypothetical protein
MPWVATELSEPIAYKDIPVGTPFFFIGHGIYEDERILDLPLAFGGRDYRRAYLFVDADREAIIVDRDPGTDIFPSFNECTRRSDISPTCFNRLILQYHWEP